MEIKAVILTTTPSVEGKTIVEYCGLVHDYDERMGRYALDGMREQARKLGADGIVGIQIATCYGGIDGLGTALRDVFIIGTAVKLK